MDAMPMVFAYCLTTNGMDVHSASTLVSVLSVRRRYPGAQILVLTDYRSSEALKECRHPLREAVNEIIVVPVPDGSPGTRNRFIKTQLRSLLAGEFLYLDADTVVVGPLEDLFQTPAPFAAAANHNNSGTVEPAFAYELETFRANGWNIPGSTYVNGGVLFFRDTPETHVFSEMWHRKWLQASQSGKHHDQPALNSALWDSQIAYAVLPHWFNAQVQVRPHMALGASIWHIYASLPGELSPRTGLDVLVLRFLAQGIVDESALEKFCQQRHPWVRRSVLDAIVIQRMLRRSDFLPVSSFERKWLSGHRSEALRGLKAKLEGILK